MSTLRVHGGSTVELACGAAGVAPHHLHTNPVGDNTHSWLRGMFGDYSPSALPHPALPDDNAGALLLIFAVSPCSYFPAFPARVIPAHKVVGPKPHAREPVRLLNQDVGSVQFIASSRLKLSVIDSI